MKSTLVYRGTEMRFDELMSHLRSSKIETQLLQSKTVDNPFIKTRSEDVYLIDSVAMKVKVMLGESAMSVNDSVYLSLVGKEEHVDKIEEIIKLYFSR